MSKSTIICESCGQDNEFGATFCIECGASISISKSGKLPPIEEPKTSSHDSNKFTKSGFISNKSYDSVPKTSRSPRRRHRPMMMGFNPMFIMMPLMIIIIIIVFIFTNFES